MFNSTVIHIYTPCIQSIYRQSSRKIVNFIYIDLWFTPCYVQPCHFQYYAAVVLLEEGKVKSAKCRVLTKKTNPFPKFIFWFTMVFDFSGPIVFSEKKNLIKVFTKLSKIFIKKLINVRKNWFIVILKCGCYTLSWSCLRMVCKSSIELPEYGGLAFLSNMEYFQLEFFSVFGGRDIDVFSGVRN